MSQLRVQIVRKTKLGFDPFKEAFEEVPKKIALAGQFFNRAKECCILLFGCGAWNIMKHSGIQS